jgi:hypothetical protein
MSDTQSADLPLPALLPIFPLSGVLLLPDGKLPLNIFEPRYLDMVRDAMAGDRMIGMVQPVRADDSSAAPKVYQIGGAGRITTFKETDDDRLLITLTGVSRFAIAEELDTTTHYRQVVADWQPFDGDRQHQADAPGVDRARLLMALRAYLELEQIPAEWDAIAKAATGPLITSLAMICPFGASEKQALLEAPDLLERSRILTALVEMALLQRAGGGQGDDDDDHQVH